MPKKISTEHLYRKDEMQVSTFVNGLLGAATEKGGVLDSVATGENVYLDSANDYVKESIRGSGKLPEKLQAVFDHVGDDGGKMVTKAILNAVSLYEQSHGTAAPADVVNQAIHTAYTMTNHARRKYSLDSVTQSNHHNPQSIEPGRIVVSILSTLSEAIPFANYLPPSLASNEARLAVVSNIAGSTYGGYTENGRMDGVLSGESYIAAERNHKGATTDGATFTGKITAIQKNPDECEQAAPVVKLIRGASVIYVSGRPVGRETEITGSGNSPLTGKIEIGGSSFQIGGYINTDTGEFSVTCNPALPAEFRNTVIVEAHVDYERQPELTPVMKTEVETYSHYARPWRVRTSQTPDARSQMSNELGLDPYSQQLLAVQMQAANERHYRVLKKAIRLGVNNSDTFNFDWSSQKMAKARDQVWIDGMMASFALLDQKMAEQTLSHGITHLCVGKNMGAEMIGLPRDIFEPSGLHGRAGIFRLGRLRGMYDVYYYPKYITETPTSSDILCVGSSYDPARNAFILGDVVAPTIIPLAVGQDLNTGAGYFARGFTDVTRYAPSQNGCALLQVTNRK